MAFTPIKSIVQKGIDSAGLRGPVEAAKVCEAFDRVVIELFGDSMQGKTKALYIKNATLTVSATSSVIGQELKLREREIIQRINGIVGGDIVERLRFLA